jgi:DNA-binding NtrC family response regulator
MKTDKAPLAATRTPNPQGSLLLVEPDAELRKAMSLCLQEGGWRILLAGDVAEACKILKRESPEVLVMNVGSPPERQGTTVELFREHRAEDHRGFVLVIADQHLEEAWRRKYRPDAVIFKPFDVRHLARTIFRWMETTG